MVQILIVRNPWGSRGFLQDKDFWGVLEFQLPSAPQGSTELGVVGFVVPLCFLHHKFHHKYNLWGLLGSQ